MKYLSILLQVYNNTKRADKDKEGQCSEVVISTLKSHKLLHKQDTTWQEAMENKVEAQRKAINKAERKLKECVGKERYLRILLNRT